MAISYLEKLATTGTGRLTLASRKSARGRIIVYPATVGFRDLIRLPGNEDSFRNYFIPFDAPDASIGCRLRAGLRLIWHLIRIAPVCHDMRLYCLDRAADGSCVMIAACFARLGGLPVTYYDYGFRHVAKRSRAAGRPALFRHVEYGDTTANNDTDGRMPSISFRLDHVDISCYQECAKKRAVPRVIVYGDFTDPASLSIIARTRDMVKQKYPRTEFFLVSLTEFDPGVINHVDGSVDFYFPRSEEEMRGLFSEADSVMLLTPGGVNRLFVSRARAAGFPVIVNGLDYPEIDLEGSPFIPAARGSYSELAEAVISLVDDEIYYRHFRNF